MTPTADPQLEALIEYIKTNRGFDFTGYKRASLARRTQKRMQSLGVETYGEYLDYLEGNPDEFVELFDAILINVTSFFRDKEAWDYLSEHVVPQLIALKEPDSPIRIWCAGSASGEEAYSIAMVLTEQLDPERFREEVKVYATDLDEDALNRGRRASFSAKEVEAVPEGLRERYFEVDQRILHLPERPSPLDHLRSPRPGPGCAHFENRPPHLPEYADVFQRGDPSTRRGPV